MDKVGEEFYDANHVIMDDGRGDDGGKVMVVKLMVGVR